MYSHAGRGFVVGLWRYLAIHDAEPDSEIGRTLRYMGLDAAFSIVASRAHAAADLAGA